MTNKNINDFLKESITVFRTYRDRRPVNEVDLEDAYKQFADITGRYGIYDEDGIALNGWIYDFIFHGLLRELAKKEAND